MINIDFSKKELEAIIAGLRERENRMYKDSELYRDQGNKLAQMDCIEEMHIAEHLRKRLQEAARTYQDRERARAKEEARDYVEWMEEMERDRRNGAGTD